MMKKCMMLLCVVAIITIVFAPLTNVSAAAEGSNYLVGDVVLVNGDCFAASDGTGGRYKVYTGVYEIKKISNRSWSKYKYGIGPVGKSWIDYWTNEKALVQAKDMFKTVKKDVSVWKKPTSKSVRIKKIKQQGTSITIVSLITNKYGNLWGKTNEGYFIYMKNLRQKKYQTVKINGVKFYDLTNQIFEGIALPFQMAYEFYNTSDPLLHIDWFYSLVKKGGDLDIKVKKKWEKAFDVPYLGLKGKFVCFDEVMNAEQLGNYLYGFIGNTMGLGSELLLWGGGYAEIKERYPGKDMYEIIKMPILRNKEKWYGDDKQDSEYILKGYSLFGRKAVLDINPTECAQDLLCDAAIRMMVRVME